MNTYRLEPVNPFKPDRVREVLKTVLDKELEGLQYEPLNCAKKCLILSNDIRNRVRQMGFDR